MQASLAWVEKSVTSIWNFKFSQVFIETIPIKGDYLYILGASGRIVSDTVTYSSVHKHACSRLGLV